MEFPPDDLYVDSGKLQQLMRTDQHSRRAVIKSVAGAAFTCATCSQGVTALADDRTVNEEDGHTSSDDVREVSELEWNEKSVEGTPLVVRYVDGYEDDADMLHGIVKSNYPSIQKVYPHTPPGTVTVDLYPASEFEHPHDSTSYDLVNKAIPMVTPSEYDGSRNTSDTEAIESYYTHAFIHEYTHAPQLAALTSGDGAFGTPRWFIEGFSEAIAVYKTNDDLRERYHNREDSQRMQDHVANGHGYLMMMNSDVWRGSMHVFRYLFDEYGVEAVAEMYEQDAEHFVQAMEMSLGITPVDMQAGWLEYASNEYGGDYSEDLQKLQNTGGASPSSEGDCKPQESWADTVVGGVVGSITGLGGGYLVRGEVNERNDTEPEDSDE